MLEASDAQVVEILQQRSLGDGDLLQVSSVKQLPSSTLLEIHRFAAQIKRICIESGCLVTEIRMGSVEGVRLGASEEQ
jgi:hypothetical protein